MSHDTSINAGDRHAGSLLGAGMLLVLLSAVSFGMMPIFTKLAYAGMDFPQDHRVKTVLAIRFALAAACMWAIWLFELRRSDAPATSAGPLRLSNVLLLVGMGALGYVGQSFSYFTALGSISASATGLLLYTYPILVTLLAWLILRERMESRKLLALGVATVGALMVLGIFTSWLGGTGLGTLNPAGVAWGLSAAGIYSLYIIAGARITRGISPIFASAVIITSAACVYTVWGLVAGELHLGLRWEAWVWTISIALICTVFAIITFFAGLAKVGPSRTAIASTMEPAVTVGLAALVLQESVTPEQLAGGALILAAVVLLQTRRNKV
jgi:drug/metabolite transporter (DMT)-like permease